MRLGAWALVCAVCLSGCAAQAPVSPAAPGIAAIPTRDNPGCWVVRVVDGDTLHLRCKDGQGNVRLTGFDTPETFRPGCAAEARLGERAKQMLEAKLRGARVIAPKFEGTDKYDRALVRLTLDGVPLSATMIKAGLAVPYDGGKRIDWCRKLSA